MDLAVLDSERALLQAAADHLQMITPRDIQEGEPKVTMVLYICRSMRESKATGGLHGKERVSLGKGKKDVVVLSSNREFLRATLQSNSSGNFAGSQEAGQPWCGRYFSRSV